MNTHNLEKLDVYKRGSLWMRIYMFAYLYGFVILYSFVMLGFLVNQDMWIAILNTWSGKAVTYEGIHSIASVILVGSVILNAVLLPMVNRPAYLATMAHQLILLTHRPLIWVFTKLLIGGEMPDSFGSYTSFLMPITIVFVATNLWYFYRRRDLFHKDIVKIITGMEKDEITSEFR